MPKKVFSILPKVEGSKDHLNFGEDYKEHYESHHVDLVEREQLPLLLKSYIYFNFVLKGKSSPESEMWKLKQMKNNKSNRVASGYKIGHPPKSGVS
eukprot:10697132-Ditylum_brightwellii.AAC.1